MTRILYGVVLILHGLAHAGAGMWADAPAWIITPLWLVATVGFVSAGAGMVGVPRFSGQVTAATIAATVASLALLVFFRHPLAIVGAALDLALLGIALLPGADSPARQASPAVRSRRRPVAFIVTVIVLAYASAVIGARPWAMRMGTSAADRAIPLFGDALYPDAGYVVDNAITIRAPVDSVWPWLAQIGQDRGGFYSHEWLEDLFGARVTNADSVVPGWTERHAGDFVHAVPPGYLGGAFGDSLGWRIVAIEPGRAIVLENWGAFTLRPIDSVTTRFQIRQRNPGVPSLSGTLVAPVGVLLLEPAHFIMQRGMLRGLRDRAEGRFQRRG